MKSLIAVSLTDAFYELFLYQNETRYSHTDIYLNPLKNIGHKFSPNLYHSRLIKVPNGINLL